MKHVLLLFSMSVFAILNAAEPVALTKLSPHAGWKRVAPEKFEIRHDGKSVAHLMADATILPKSYYRISWNSEAGADYGKLNPATMIRLEETNYIYWNPSERKAPRSICFYSGNSSSINFSLYLPRNCDGMLHVENLKLELLDDADLRMNLFRNYDFELENRLPGEWLKSWNQEKRVESIVRMTDFLAGEQSLSIVQEQKKASAAINSLPLPILPGKSYTLSFWAKGDGSQKLRVSTDLPNNGKSWKHFNIRKTFLLEKNWKQYSISVSFPSDETEYPALRNRMSRISFINENGMPGCIFLDQIEFRIAE